MKASYYIESRSIIARKKNLFIFAISNAGYYYYVFISVMAFYIINNSNLSFICQEQIRWHQTTMTRICLYVTSDGFLTNIKKSYHFAAAYIKKCTVGECWAHNIQFCVHLTFNIEQ